MYRVKFKYIAVLLSVALLCSEVSAQQALTKDQIMNMSIEELSELPLEDLMQAVETLGVSSVDELFALIMNKNVSSASKKEESSFTSPLSTTVITHDELRTYGCTTIEEAFRLIPGMIVQQKTNGIYDVQMRGLSNIPDNNMLLYTENNNTLLMIDGRVMHDYGIGAMFSENIPISIEDIERIEVVRGACSALYGTNAVNGVINIITRKPDSAEESVSGSFQMGNQSTYVGEVALRKAFNDKVAGGLSFNIHYAERPNDKVRVLSDSQYYLDMDDAYSTTDVVSLNAITEAVSNGTLVPVDGNQELTLDQYNHLRNLGTNLTAGLLAMHAQQSALMQLVANGMTMEEASAYIAANTDMSSATIYSLYNTSPVEYSNANDVFPNVRMARKTFGLNGYLTFTPNSDVRIDLTGGYSHAYANSTTLVECPYALNTRIMKTGYVNADARIHDLHLLFNYAAGPGDYAYGRPGLKVFAHKVFGTAEYDINLGSKDSWGELGIRPGINMQYVYVKDEKTSFDYGDGNGAVELSGFLNDDAKIKSFAPALRADYKNGGLRLILGARADKTNIPDKWNISAQAVASYQFNDKNFIRASWGRGFRSASCVSSAAKYIWLRDGMGAPNSLHFQVNEDADIMHIDNFELGYRVKPSQTVIVDAEVFYSKSQDYGAMTAASSEFDFKQDGMNTVGTMLSSLSERPIEQILNGIINYGLPYAMQNYVNTRTYVKYDNMPFEVHQLGLGVNVDWIISPKLVAKINANVQRTQINNYYQYGQVENIAEQISTASEALSSSFGDVVMAILGRDFIPSKINNDEAYAKIDGYSRTMEEFAAAVTNGSAADQYKDWYNSLDRNEQEAFASALRTGWMQGNDVVEYNGVSYEEPMALYYALKYNIRWKNDKYTGSEFVLGDAQSKTYEQHNGHVHKATPAVYGMVGLIYRPTKQWNIAAYGNFIGKRTYQTMYGSAELSPRLTVNLHVGYKPVDNFEIYFTGNNILNNEKQEFVYSDKIGGLYSVGINFAF